MRRLMAFILIGFFGISWGAACRMARSYPPRRINVKAPSQVTNRFPVPVLLGRFSTRGLGDRGWLHVPRSSSSFRAADVGQQLKMQIASWLNDTPVFTRLLRPLDPKASLFVEVSSRIRTLQIERDEGLRLTGSVEFTGSIWPSAVQIWTASVAVTAVDVAEADRFLKQKRGRNKSRVASRAVANALDAFVSRAASVFIQKLSNSPRIAAATHAALVPARTALGASLAATAPPAVSGPAKGADSVSPARTSVVAVFDFQAKGLPFRPDELSGLTDYLGAALIETGRYEVVPREALIAALRRQKKESYKDCYAEACQIEIGKELAAEKTLYGSIVGFGEQCIVTLRLFDLRKATQESAGTARAGCDGAAVLEAIEDAMAKLTRAAVVR